MAFGMGEDTARSVTTHLDAATYPATRDDLVQVASDGGAPADIINIFKCLPEESYDSKDGVLRDLSEASRRFAMGTSRDEDEGEALRDRRNIGRDMVEGAPDGMTRHP